MVRDTNTGATMAARRRHHSAPVAAAPPLRRQHHRLDGRPVGSPASPALQHEKLGAPAAVPPRTVLVVPLRLRSPARSGGGVPWLEEASASKAQRQPHAVARASSTTRGSSRSSPAPCARSRAPPSAARSSRRAAPSSRSWPCWPARSAPGSRSTPRSASAQRAEQLKRLDGIGTILAKTTARDTSLLSAARRGRRRLRGGPRAQARDAPGRRRRGGRGGRGRRPSPPPPPSTPSARSCRGRCSPTSSPTRSCAPTSPAPPARPAPAGSPAGSSSSRCSSRSSAPPAGRCRACALPERHPRSRRPPASS